MGRADQLLKVAEFSKTAKTKKEVAEFGNKVFGFQADVTLVARTKKADLLDALLTRAVELMERDERRRQWSN